MGAAAFDGLGGLLGPSLADRTVLVIDTKWKRMAPRIDDPKQGVSQADVYQLMAYSQLYRCPNVMLLYPHHGDLPPDPIRTRYAIASEGAEDSLLVATMDVTGSSQTHAEALKHLIQGALREHAARRRDSDDARGCDRRHP